MSYDGKNLKDLGEVMSSKLVDFPLENDPLSPLDLNLSYPRARFVVPLNKGLMGQRLPKIPMLGSRGRAHQRRKLVRFDLVYTDGAWRVTHEIPMKMHPLSWRYTGKAFWELPIVQQIATEQHRGYLVNLNIHANGVERAFKFRHMQYLDEKSKVLLRLMGPKTA